jgi:hypothetical protein
MMEPSYSLQNAPLPYVLVTQPHRNDFVGAPTRLRTSCSLMQPQRNDPVGAQIEQLPDLQGFLKFASQPQWKRVRLAAPS